MQSTLGLGGAASAPPPPASSASGSSSQPASALSSSLAMLASQDSMAKIKDMLPGDGSARTELLLSLLKTSYSSSLHSADVRMASLTQEISTLRAQHSYVESKLRACEALAEEAGRAGEEQRKRADLLLQENVRLRAENQALKGENAQLANFKELLRSAAATGGTSFPAPQTTTTTHQGTSAFPAGGGMFGTGGATPHPHTYFNPSPPFPPLSAADLNSRHQPSSIPPPSSTGATQQQYQQQQQYQPQQQQQQQHPVHQSPQHQPQQQPSVPAAHQTFFFSPLKARPHDSISVSNLNGSPATAPEQQQYFLQVPPSSHPSQPHTHSTPFPPPRRPSTYVHVMPSPLSADALSSPPPAPAAAAAQRRDHETTTAGLGSGHDDILSEINAHLHLSSSRGRQASPSPSPPTAQRRLSATQAHGNGFASSMAAAASSFGHSHDYSHGHGHSHAAHTLSASRDASATSSSFSASASAAGSLVEQARALFQTAQARLPSRTFGDFVALVQQFRAVSNLGLHAGGGAHSWEGIRQRAAELLGQHQDILQLFEQLLQATQVQQQQRS